jgi:hypothetical protein
MRNAEPARDPRPQADDGTYLCYHEGCSEPADVAVPQRIESTGVDPVQTAVTKCLTHHLAFEVLGDTRRPLASTLDVQQSLVDDGHADPDDWTGLRLHARALANVLLFDDPRGSDPPAEDSPLTGMFEQAGEPGDRLREFVETPVEEQLHAFDYPDIADGGSGDDDRTEGTDLGEFS